MPTPQVIWLNGAFGVGKTTVARALGAQVPEALTFDPEDVGLMLRKSVPSTLRRTADFQDIPLWRRLTVATIRGLVQDYQRPLIVPMTIATPVYFDETIGELRKAGVPVHHFALVASPKTIRKRLTRRLAFPGSTRWALQQVERCTEALQSPQFATHVATDQTSVSDIVATIRRAAAV